MEYRQLGRSGVRVSKLCLGTMNFVSSTDLPEAKRIIDEAIDAGVNFVDTADVYARGGSEEYVGIALKENGRRDDIVLATKAVAWMGEGPNDHGASRYHLTRAVESSLRRLQTDRIDLFYLHITDITTPLDEILETLDVLVRQGKILYIGTSKWPVPLFLELLTLAEIHDLPQTVAEQPPYNLTDRRIEWEMVWACMRKGIGIIPFGPLAGGILSGVYRRGKKPPSGHKFKEIGQRDFHNRYTDETMELVEGLVPLAEARGVSLAEFSLAWLMHRPGVTAPICGPRTVEHLRSSVRAAGLELSQEEMDAVDRIIPPGGHLTSYFTLYDRMCRAVNKLEPLEPF
jgi:aryl-alcohol dehydrogenase-like predicted oxidoreductase